VAHEGHGGLVQVDIRSEDGRIGMLRLRLKRPEIGRRLPADQVARVARALGLEEESLQAANQPVKIASAGLPCLIVPVATREALAGARPRYGDLHDVAGPLGATIVYAFTKETRDPKAAAHARAFDTIGASELPGAGAAAGALSAYLVAHAAVPVAPVTALAIEQGHAVGRPSTLFVEVHVDLDKGGKKIRESEDGTETRRLAIGGIYLGARVIRVGDGQLEI
jgi:PhzF family phenazine biosynthesis protein